MDASSENRVNTLVSQLLLSVVLEYPGDQLGRRLLREFATIVTPDTLLAWHRIVIAKQYDGGRVVVPDGRQ